MSAKNRSRMLIGGVVLVVIAAIVCGLIAIGPPEYQRDRKLDQRRVKDLSLLFRYVSMYWHDNKKLPPDLGTLAKLPGFRLPKDPQTSKEYEYIPTGETTFELCAGFTLDTSADSQPNRFPDHENWLHGTGRTCFERHVKKASYED